MISSRRSCTERSDSSHVRPFRDPSMSACIVPATIKSCPWNAHRFGNIRSTLRSALYISLSSTSNSRSWRLHAGRTMHDGYDVSLLLCRVPDDNSSPSTLFSSNNASTAERSMRSSLVYPSAAREKASLMTVHDQLGALFFRPVRYAEQPRYWLGKSWVGTYPYRPWTRTFGRRRGPTGQTRLLISC